MPQRLPIVSDFPRTSAVFSLKVGAVTHGCTNLGRQGFIHRLEVVRSACSLRACSLPNRET